MGDKNSNKAVAIAEAISRAVAKLQAAVVPEEQLHFKLFSRTIELDPTTFAGSYLDTSQPLHPADHLLALHYLLAGPGLQPAGQWATYRQFPGGENYFKPFEARTTDPLIAAIGDDLPTLARRLAPFGPRPLGLGDLSATIQAIGPFELGLVYHNSDSELPPSAEILFDANLRLIFQAEDAAALASRFCLPLMQKTCPSCSGCNLCDPLKQRVIETNPTDE